MINWYPWHGQPQGGRRSPRGRLGLGAELPVALHERSGWGCPGRCFGWWWKKLWKKHRKTRKTMENHGKIWKTMEKYGKPWKNMENHGKIWENMGKYGKIWDMNGIINGINLGNLDVPWDFTMVFIWPMAIQEGKCLEVRANHPFFFGIFHNHPAIKGYPGYLRNLHLVMKKNLVSMCRKLGFLTFLPCCESRIDKPIGTEDRLWNMVLVCKWWEKHRISVYFDIINL